MVGIALLIVCGREVVPLWQNMTKRSVRSHRVYKPSPNEQLFPGLCPIFSYLLIIVSVHVRILLVYTYIVTIVTL